MVLQNKTYSNLSFPFIGHVPNSFNRIWKDNPAIQRLWNNDGELSRDIEKADLLLIKESIRNNITDIKDLYAILIMKPEGAFQKHGKGDSYLRRTIGKAVYK